MHFSKCAKWLQFLKYSRSHRYSKIYSSVDKYSFSFSINWSIVADNVSCIIFSCLILWIREIRRRERAENTKIAAASPGEMIAIWNVTQFDSLLRGSTRHLLLENWSAQKWKAACIVAIKTMEHYQNMQVSILFQLEASPLVSCMVAKLINSLE